MNMHTIRQFAKTLSIDPGKLSKPELIKKIQLTEGNFDCFGTAISGECDQVDCSWRSDCLGRATLAPQEVH
jgi:hypothetical protein